MRIHRVKGDVNNYQSLLIDQEKWGGNLLDFIDRFDCPPVLATWSPPPVFVLHPKKKQGNFYQLASFLLAVDCAAMEQLADLLEMSGELLPLPYEDQLFHVANVTECVNILDEDKTEWRTAKNTGERVGIERYAFHPKRFVETPLFKIPETFISEILTIEGMKNPEDEFKGRVQRCGLKGLVFEQIWTDEQ